jgi:hypothetical protein
MKCLGHASIDLTLNAGVALALRFPFEVSLDCFVCRRRLRTVIFNELAGTGVCAPNRHDFDGRLLELAGAVGRAHASFSYDYMPFSDAKYPAERYRAFDPGAPTWARFNYILTCNACGSSCPGSTQTNIVRPWSQFCKCGQRLAQDLESPRLSWSESP